MSQFEAIEVTNNRTFGDASVVQRKSWVAPAVIVSQARGAESANGSAPSDFVTSSIPYSS